jgi:FAD/FMN-containing dehydrogenase/Fe-S oxidoreductase
MNESPFPLPLRSPLPGSVRDRTGASASVAAALALAADLRREVAGEVRFDAGSRSLYATDASNYRQVPVGVVIPRDGDDFLAALDICRRHRAPLLPRGAGTSLAGQGCNVAVVFDFSRHFRRILELDPALRRARVEPGVVLDDLRQEAEGHGLTFGPDPATHRTCTLGGMIGNNSCGVHSVMAGRTDENVEALDVVTADGTRLSVGRTSEADLARILAAGGRAADIHRRLAALVARHGAAIRARFPDIPRRVSGYNLPALLPENGFDVAKSLVGSEGTCAFVLEATVRLVESPPERCLLVLGFEDVYAAADRVPEILAHRPIGLEGLDSGLVEDMRRANLHLDSLAALPEGAGWLLVEFGGETAAGAAAAAQGLIQALGGHAAKSVTWRLFETDREQRQMWRTREAALGATSHPPGRPLTWEGWEDSAVHPEKLGRYLRDLRALLTAHGYGGDFYGHFGQACVHTRTDFDLRSAEGIARYRRFVEEAADLVVSYGGSLSGEHGDGQSRGELLPRMFGEELVGAFREFKSIWDPEGRMNPGKLIDARPLDADLRLSGRTAAPPRTAFAYAADGGDFSLALERCVGVSLCRREDGGTMCPSWRATHEEAHSTRGRARLLSEMLRGETIAGGWRNESVRDALDLCLSCKGCKGDCPVEVDMATYKAEFLSHYYEGRLRLRPRAAYAMGWIHRWTPLAERAPRLVNFLTHAPVLSGVARAIAGISPHRDIPRFARRSFRSTFAAAARAGLRRSPPSGARVLLWPDTFSDAFHPETARAAAEVLEAAGFSVEIPAQRLCCGRPLYDHGMLDRARALLAKILDSLREPIRSGVPVIVLEPSCAAVFRDELTGLFPGDPDAARLRAQTYFFAEFLERRAPGWTPGTISGSAILQGHCHQKALASGSLEDERALLQRLGLSVRISDSGCCGMAGAFGFERDHYDVSVAVARGGLLPDLAREPDALLVADGFSCREQIRQLAGRPAFHVAEVVRRALERA